MGRLWEWWGLTAILLVGLVLRLWDLGSRGIYVDEAFSIVMSKMTPSDMMLEIARDASHPPLYYYLLHEWLLLGDSEFIARLLSVMLGVIAMAGIFLLGRQLFNWRVGLAATSIMAISPFQIQYSQTVRMYTLLTALAVFSTYFLIQALREPRARSWTAYALVTGLGIYTHYFMLLVMLSQDIYFLVFRKEYRRSRSTLFGVQVALMVLLAGYAMVALLLAGLPDIGRESASRLAPAMAILSIASPFYAFSLGELQPTARLLPLIVVGALTYLVLFVAGLSGFLRRQLAKEAVLLLVLLLPVLVSAPLAMFLPKLGASRFLVTASPAYYLIIAWGAYAVKRTHIRAAMLALLLLVSGLSLAQYYSGDPQFSLRESAKYIEQHLGSKEVIIHTDGNSFLNFIYYFPGLKEQYILDAKPGNLRTRQGRDMQISRTLTLEEAAKGKERIWLVSYQAEGARSQLLENLGNMETGKPQEQSDSAPSTQQRLAEIGYLQSSDLYRKWPGGRPVEVSAFSLQ